MPKGSCVCGAVEFEIRPPYRFFQYCHCSRCRKRSGSIHAANVAVPADQAFGQGLISHGAGVRNVFTLNGDSLHEPWLIFRGQALRMFDKAVRTRVEVGAGPTTTSHLLHDASGAEVSPWEGQMGMFHEFESTDWNGTRTTVAFDLPLTARRKAESWKIKIRNFERNEPPHVTVVHKTRAWRVGLRDLKFLDRDPPSREVPDDVVDAIRDNIDVLRAAWDDMYPENPV